MSFQNSRLVLAIALAVLVATGGALLAGRHHPKPAPPGSPSANGIADRQSDFSRIAPAEADRDYTEWRFFTGDQSN